MISRILRWRCLPRSRRLPLYLVQFVTYRCNARCRTCFYHEHLRAASSGDLPISFHEQLASSLRGLEWLHLSGGEPFMREDLPELVRAYNQRAGVRRVGIPNNGLLPARVERACSRILADCPDAQLNIVLSLDGLEKTHDHIRGVPGNWGLTLETLERLKQLGRRHPQLSINVCTVLNNLNAAELPELLRLVWGLGVGFHDVGLMRGSPLDPDLELPPIGTIHSVLAEVERYARRYYQASPLYPGRTGPRAARVHRHLNRSFVGHLQDGAAFQHCFAGDGFAVVEPNGDVRLCELTPVIGSLLPHAGNFRSFWHSAEVRTARMAGRCPRGGCTHSNFQTRNFLLNPRHWWRALP